MQLQLFNIIERVPDLVHNSERNQYIRPQICIHVGMQIRAELAFIKNKRLNDRFFNIQTVILCLAHKRFGDCRNRRFHLNRAVRKNIGYFRVAEAENIDLPVVNMNDLGSIMDNYSIYYAAASLASVCESIFRFDGMNGQLRQYIKKHTIDNYWNFMDKIMLMKQYTVVVSFCYKLSNFDINDYREDPEYQGEILYSFERAEKFSRELKKNE